MPNVKYKISKDMKDKINDLLLKMQTGENCIGETANALLNLYSVSDMFSADDMRIAFEDGEHYGKGGDASIFDIENYR